MKSSSARSHLLYEFLLAISCKVLQKKRLRDSFCILSIGHILVSEDMNFCGSTKGLSLLLIAPVLSDFLISKSGEKKS
jgi:hypothetical protein